ncbi:hypothetical protein J437_LFUL000582 [Ladona fulva]|uniref:Phosphatidylinositol N-acetylglucosaminyltransferase subunit C n=1 Tax=Ladona fulva TaxID=123851 RepID=A0A8K0K8G2_LADFU|nr:hypothetical protein J437_LFUL000582 [Ladona fulva]
MRKYSEMDSEARRSIAGRCKTKPKPWRKNLYDNKGYKDNYTDESFLEELRKNIHFQEVHYRAAFIKAGLVTQQLCVVVLYSLLFASMDVGWIEPVTVLYLCGITTTLGYIIRTFLSPRFERSCHNSSKASFSGGSIFTDLVTVIKCLALGYIVSPVLKTLTETISTDTIQAAAAIAFIVHLATYDYGIGNEPGLPYRATSHKSDVIAPSHWSKSASSSDKTVPEKYLTENIPSASRYSRVQGSKTSSLPHDNPSRTTSALSLNAAIFGAICLASRLESPSHAFALLSVAGLAFALSPPFLRLLHHWPPARVAIPLALFIATVYSLFICCGGTDGEDWVENQIPVALFIIVVAFLNILCPCMFVLWQTHKDNIYGPWDEAIPLIQSTAHNVAVSD